MNEYIEIIKNTEIACALCDKEFSHQELIEIIKGENAIEKQICILKLQKTESQKEADILIFNLTNHHVIIREAAAVKINELMKDEKYCPFFQTEKITDIFLDAIIDINPNICRLIIEILSLVSDKDMFFQKLYQRTITVVKDAKTMNIRNKGYEYSRKIFKVFWYLEAICELGYFTQEKKLAELLSVTYDFKDYTIREKTAKIISMLPSNEPYIHIIESLKEDENYFVRRFLTLNV